MESRVRLHLELSRNLLAFACNIAIAEDCMFAYDKNDNMANQTKNTQ